jgi:hypothetical protein
MGRALSDSGTSRSSMAESPEGRVKMRWMRMMQAF